MASRKVEITVKVKLSIRVDEGQEISQVVNELEYDFTDTTGNADIEDTEILEYEVIDSR